ncbi:MAG: hypothetical protein ACOC7S_00880 [Planctomycetota bacterium]
MLGAGLAGGGAAALGGSASTALMAAGLGASLGGALSGPGGQDLSYSRPPGAEQALQNQERMGRADILRSGHLAKEEARQNLTSSGLSDTTAISSLYGGIDGRTSRALADLSNRVVAARSNQWVPVVEGPNTAAYQDLMGSFGNLAGLGLAKELGLFGAPGGGGMSPAQDLTQLGQGPGLMLQDTGPMFPVV